MLCAVTRLFADAKSAMLRVEVTMGLPKGVVKTACDACLS